VGRSLKFSGFWSPQNQITEGKIRYQLPIGKKRAQPLLGVGIRFDHFESLSAGGGGRLSRRPKIKLPVTILKQKSGSA
jgi:hypothetical protein